MLRFKRFVLIDLKTKKITHQDVGQMDMYVRMYDELKRVEGEHLSIIKGAPGGARFAERRPVLL